MACISYTGVSGLVAGTEQTQSTGLLESANDDVKFEANSQGFPRVGEPLGRFNSSKVAAPKVPDATVNYAE